MNRRLIATLLIAMLLLPGCLDSSGNPVTTNDDVDNSNNVPEPETDPTVAVPHTDGCDNLNALHCLLPFPSDAFLIEDETTVTGLRVNYAENTLPVSGTLSNSGGSVQIESLNLLDGMSISTQIMTAFTTLPNLTGVANQYSIGLSIEPGHATTILNLDTGEKVPHWVEIDARADDASSAIVFIRTLRSLEPNTAYGIGISGLDVTPSTAFQAILDGYQTDAPDVEARQESMSTLIQALNTSGHDVENLKEAWQFHTASLDSIVGPMLSMRADALGRLGDDGINCTVESVETDWMDDTDTDFRLIKRLVLMPMEHHNL
jgi:hypothetical protein